MFSKFMAGIWPMAGHCTVLESLSDHYLLCSTQVQDRYDDSVSVMATNEG